MKKLMIAAMVVASVGAASAADTDAIYDFTASLKTTQGKAGKDAKSTYTVNLGWDGVSKFWYDDADINKGTGALQKGSFTDADGKTKYLKDETKGLVVYNAKKDAYSLDSKVLKNMTEECKMAAAIFFGWDGKTYVDGKYAETKYNTKSMNKWCENFKFSVVTPAACYRVSGSEKIKVEGWLDSDDCCDLVTTLFNRFGGQTLAKATKVEIYDDNLTFTTTTGRDGTFALAGQGTWKDGLAKDLNGDPFDGVSSISGNIVGQLDPSDCMTCCKYPQKALAFDCSATGDANASTTLDTAAFGTFTIKFNKGKSFKEDK